MKRKYSYGDNEGILELELEFPHFSRKISEMTTKNSEIFMKYIRRRLMTRKKWGKYLSIKICRKKCENILPNKNLVKI